MPGAVAMMTNTIVSIHRVASEGEILVIRTVPQIPADVDNRLIPAIGALGALQACVVSSRYAINMTVNMTGLP